MRDRTFHLAEPVVWATFILSIHLFDLISVPAATRAHPLLIGLTGVRLKADVWILQQKPLVLSLPGKRNVKLLISKFWVVAALAGSPTVRF